MWALLKHWGTGEGLGMNCDQKGAGLDALELFMNSYLLFTSHSSAGSELDRAVAAFLMFSINMSAIAMGNAIMYNPDLSVPKPSTF